MAHNFPKNFWDLILPQIELTLNLLRQATLTPKIPAWVYFQGPFDCKATPLGPLGCPVIIHWKTSNCNYWDFRGKEWWSIGMTLDHYCCQCTIPYDNKSDQVSNTVESRHQSIATPLLTPEDNILYGLNTLTGAFTYLPTDNSDSQLQDITALRNASSSWASSGDTPAPSAPILLSSPFQPRCSPRVQKRMLKQTNP